MNADTFNAWLDKLAADQIAPGGIETVDESSVDGQQSGDAPLLEQAEGDGMPIGNRSAVETLSTSGEEVARQGTSEYNAQAFDNYETSEEKAEDQLEKLFDVPVTVKAKRTTKQAAEEEFFRALKELS